MKDDLGDRMKQYEKEYKYCVPEKSYSIIRVDGKAFHTFTQGLTQPYDARLAQAMDQTALALASGIQGAITAYVQSDEISVVFTDMQSDNSQPWFGGVVQKQASIASSLATAHFNKAAVEWTDKIALFDARVFTLPNISEVANYLLWRQKDAIRNSVSMLAQSNFSHHELQGVNVTQMLEKLLIKGVGWEQYDSGVRFGRLAEKITKLSEIVYEDKRTGEMCTAEAMRSFWEIKPASKLDFESAISIVDRKDNYYE